MNTSESIAAYVTAVNAAFDAIDASNISASASVTALAADIKFIADELAKIQNSPGTLSAVDQASLDASLGRATTAATNAKAAADALAALDKANTPPVAPVSV